MSLVGRATVFLANVGNTVVEKFAPLAADFSPITALVMSLFGLVILIGILKKFEKI